MGKIVGKPKELKKINKTLILNSIKKRRSATKTEIVLDTGISNTTVRTLLLKLLEENEIISVGLDESSGGRRAERYSLNISKKYILSMIVEEKKIIYNIVNIIGEVVEENTIKIESIYDDNIIDTILEDLLSQYGNIKAIGISVPGIVNKEGYLSGKDIKEWKQVEVNKYIEEKYKIPVILENDLNTLALGYAMEYKKNFQKDLNLAYVHFTTLGAGAGLIINGNLVKGKNNFAGEIGIMPIEDSYLNEVLSRNLSDDEYSRIITNVMTIINCMVSPDMIIVGGNNFKHNLIDNIKKTYSEKNKIFSEVIVVKDSIKVGLRGITKIALDLINDDIKIISNGG